MVDTGSSLTVIHTPKDEIEVNTIERQKRVAWPEEPIEQIKQRKEIRRDKGDANVQRIQRIKTGENGRN